MLYDRWTKLADGRREAVAVRDARGREWTYADLLREGESAPEPAGAVVATGGGVGFLVEVLRAWRAGVPLVPVDGTMPEGHLLRGLPDWAAHVKMTSGSTGTPKLVLFRDHQLAADADAIIATMGLQPEIANIGVISMAHSYGFSNLVTPLLLCGIPLVLVESPLPGAVGAALQLAGRAVLPAVPAMWKAWHRAGVLKSGEIALAISAGAPLTTDLERAVFEDAGLKIHNFYGASECGGIAFDATQEPRGHGRAPVGRALSGVTLSVGADGCLQVASAAVGECYWPAPGAQLQLEGGVFRTTDLAEVAEGDEVYLLGRAGDTINVAGRKVDPGCVEAVVGRLPGVEACVVFGVPATDAERGDVIVACVKLVGGADLENARRECAKILPLWQVPRRWVVADGLEPDGRGKISRHFWRETVLKGSA